jgi:hypothetical protein
MCSAHGAACRRTDGESRKSDRKNHGEGDGDMTNKQYKAYRYLSRLWRIKHEIEDKEFELYSARLASAIRYDKDSVQTSQTDPMDVIGDLIDEIREEKEKYARVQHTMINQIHGLEDRVYEQILADRFIRDMSIRQICTKYSYPKPTAYRLFCKALDAFADKYETK